MLQGLSIRYCRRQEIDDTHWDDCISRAGNGLIYGYSYYLDAMCPNWDALVLNGYEAVMPLPWRSKWGIAYLYHPFAVAQAGVFGSRITAQMLQAFFSAIPKKFRYWDFPLNYKNRFQLSGYPLFQRMNYVLPLQASYPTLLKNYRDHIRRNLKKSGEYGCTPVKDVPITAVLALTQFQPLPPAPSDLDAFKHLFALLQKKGMAQTYGVLAGNGDLLASAVFFFSHRRAYYILVGNHPNGRTLGASHALIDQFIADHAGHELLLDFEGSDIRSLAFFYSSFGAAEEPYATIRLNRLPWWIRWRKK